MGTASAGVMGRRSAAQHKSAASGIETERPSLPDTWRALFWDVDPDTLDCARHRRFILERVLELGDLPAVREMFRLYSRDEITHVVLTSRQLSRRSANFWAIVLDLEERPLACTRPSWTAQPLIS